ncbi:MAG: rRNA maturation RNase YbeY [Candidatus Cloacimonetes bacterium]|nr:rRNA maturation RNase YbeY [Candidatus Cloacimonadota bacterium]
MNKIDIQNHTSHPVNEAILRKILDLVSSGEMPGREISLSLLLCYDDEISILNKKYRGVEGSTDTLSFLHNVPMSKDEPDLMMADIVISMDRIEAQQGDKTFESELFFVFLHSLLHLCGYDHTRRTDIKIMDIKQNLYQKQIQGILESGRE